MWDTGYPRPTCTRPNGQFYVDMARCMERACFDLIMIEDTVMVADAYGGTMEGARKHSAFAPKHDPLPLAVSIAASTSRMGAAALLIGRYRRQIAHGATCHRSLISSRCVPADDAGFQQPVATLRQ